MSEVQDRVTLKKQERNNIAENKREIAGHLLSQV